MCQAFAKQGHNVTLFAIRPRDKNQLGIDPYDYFGIKRIFDIEIVRKIPIKKIGRLKYVYNTFQRVNKRSLPDIFFGRDPYCLLRVGGTGVPIIYEAHSSPRGIQRLIENWLFKQKSFYQLIVISEALRKYYINYCPHITSRQRYRSDYSARSEATKCKLSHNWRHRKGYQPLETNLQSE
jgi:hypothetical protein